jgi:hypothetical protein
VLHHCNLAGQWLLLGTAMLLLLLLLVLVHNGQPLLFCELCSLPLELLLHLLLLCCLAGFIHGTPVHNFPCHALLPLLSPLIQQPLVLLQPGCCQHLSQGLPSQNLHLPLLLLALLLKLIPLLLSCHLLLLQITQMHCCCCWFNDARLLSMLLLLLLLRLPQLLMLGLALLQQPAFCHVS